MNLVGNENRDNVSWIHTVVTNPGMSRRIVGPLFTAALLAAIMLSQVLGKVWLVLLFALVLQQVGSNIIVLNIIPKQARLSPLLTLLALLAGERIGGLVGALVAIPLVAALRVLVLEVIAPAVRRWTGVQPAGDGESAA